VSRKSWRGLLRQLVAEHRDLNAALRSDAPPAQVLALIETLSALLYPSPQEQIRTPSDVAALLMVQMGHLDQEEMRTVLLDTKNRVQDIVTVYRGSLNASLIRVGEIYKAAVRLAVRI
jgi:DNA repair protein RadC